MSLACRRTPERHGDLIADVELRTAFAVEPDGADHANRRAAFLQWDTRRYDINVGTGDNAEYSTAT